MRIPSRTHRSQVFRILALSMIASAVFAAEKLDLKRTTPVAATEPIPAMDFFRPWLLQQPVLNPSGSNSAP